MERTFERQIKEHEAMLHKLCRIYATPDERQDLFQDIVIQLWKAYPRFRGQSQFSTWLYRIAINTALTGLRKKKLPVTIIASTELPEQAYDSNMDEEENVRQMYSAIGRLNDVEKAIVMLYLEDRPYREMEEILGINEGALRVKMVRIKDKLRGLTKNG